MSPEIKLQDAVALWEVSDVSPNETEELRNGERDKGANQLHV